MRLPWLPALLLASLSPAAAGPCRLALSAIMPIRWAGNAPIITATIEDQPASFIFDTGAFASMLTPAAVARLHLFADQDRSQGFRGLQDQGELTGIGGHRQFTFVLAHSAIFSGLRGQNFHFLTSDWTSDQADGVLGQDVLDGFDIDLNYPANQVRLYKGFGDCNRPKVLLSPPLYALPFARIGGAPSAAPVVEVTVGDKVLRALLDTGAETSLLYRGGAARLGLQPGASALDPHGKIAGIGPNAVSASRHILGAVTLGDITIRNMRLAVIDDVNRSDAALDMLLGADLQRRVHFWISTSSHTLVMQVPPLPSPDIPGGP